MRRLRNLVLVLRSDEIEAESAEWPGLAAVAHTLVHQYLHHADKEVRLYTVLACVDILTIVSTVSTTRRALPIESTSDVHV